MGHPIYRVTHVEIIGPCQLMVEFDDQTAQTIDFSPILEGPIYGSLRNRATFDQVRIDPEIDTLVWPNGADFDPATLHDWPLYGAELAERAQRWSRQAVA